MYQSGEGDDDATHGWLHHVAGDTQEVPGAVVHATLAELHLDGQSGSIRVFHHRVDLLMPRGVAVAGVPAWTSHGGEGVLHDVLQVRGDPGSRGGLNRSN